MKANHLRQFNLRQDVGKSGAPLVAFKAAEVILRGLRDYHQHEVVGMENVPRDGGAVFAFNHSFATYDAMLVTAAIFEDLGRVMWGVADRLIFRTPAMGAFFRAIGFSEGTRDELIKLLKAGDLVGISPGGMREALGVRRGKYEVDWKDRLGFVRVSVLSGAPIILAACPRADDIYQCYQNTLTSWAYRKYKLPVIAFRGLGPSPAPRPVKLTHTLSEPIYPPPGKEDVSEAQIAAHHAMVSRRMNELLQKTLHT